MSGGYAMLMRTPVGRSCRTTIPQILCSMRHSYAGKGKAQRRVLVRPDRMLDRQMGIHLRKHTSLRRVSARLLTAALLGAYDV